MKRIAIGTLVGTVIFFAYQTAMWVGGIHGDFSKYSPAQGDVVTMLDQTLPEDGLYLMPSVDPSSPDKWKAEEELQKENVGKPWAMVFFHKKMPDMDISYILMGIFYSLLACLIASLLLFYGKFETMGIRFLVAMGLAIFTLAQGTLDDMNWWSYPWAFVKTEVIDMTLGWGLCSVWLAWYVKNPVAKPA